eukprot:4993332-Karenia_brevis.AAC.1
MGYATWSKVWPPEEEEVYKYLRDCAGPGSPPSRAPRFMEAIGFIHGVFGFNLQEVLGSKRLIGFASEQSARLGLRRSSPVIPFWVVRALEFKVVEEEVDNDEMVVIGAMLVMLSLRARFSDLTSCTKFEVLGDRLVATVDKTKTSQRTKSRLP